MDHEEKLKLLKSVSIFRYLSDLVLDELSSQLKAVEVPAGTLVLKKGDIGSSMYVVASGKMSAYYDDKFLGEVAIHEVFGELAAISSQKRLASVLATENSVVLEIEKDAWEKLMNTDIGFLKGIIEVLCERAYRNEGMQVRLMLQEKLASLGTLSMGIAHELKNPLNFVVNFAELCTDTINEIREYCANESIEANHILPQLNHLTDLSQKILLHGQRADAIIKRLLSHAHSGTVKPEISSIVQLIERSLSLALQPYYRKVPILNVDVHKNYDQKTNIQLLVFPEDLMRVFINIIDNACFAMFKRASDEKNYTAELDIQLLDEPQQVRIFIRDNGGGIPLDQMPKVFQPFFTTKPAGEGTGLGLLISYDIIKQHSGELKLLTDNASYTQFEILLPKGE